MLGAYLIEIEAWIYGRRRRRADLAAFLGSGSQFTEEEDIESLLQEVESVRSSIRGVAQRYESDLVDAAWETQRLLLSEAAPVPPS